MGDIVIDQYACVDDLASLVRNGELKIRAEYEEQAAAAFRGFLRIHHTLKGVASNEQTAIEECYRRVCSVPRFKEMTRSEFEKIVTPGAFTLSVFIHKFYPELR